MDKEASLLEYFYQMFLVKHGMKDSLEVRTIFNAGYKAGLSKL